MSTLNAPSASDRSDSSAFLESRAAWRESLLRELRGNILPFWIGHVAAPGGDGFLGGLTNDLRVLDDVPRSAVVVARILWTYAAAYRLYGEQAYRDMARWPHAYLAGPFRDLQNGGVYWTVDRHGSPDNDRKHVYAQAFAIYGLSEYYRATGEPDALAWSRELFRLIDSHSFDPQNGGNIECLSRTWGALDDMRLSAKEPDCRKSMNTLLHLVEAYANLLRVWDDALLRVRLAGLLADFLKHMVDPVNFHFRLFFDDAWHSLPGREGRAGLISPGHDIEEYFVDRKHGDWFKVLDRAGTPYPDQLKVGPWECPYHHSRACMEMLRRLV
jgi:cellobiose epimerase